MKREKLGLLINTIAVISFIILIIFSLWAVIHTLWFIISHIHYTYMEQIVDPGNMTVFKVLGIVILYIVNKIFLRIGEKI